MQADPICDLLTTVPELAELCTQNGWIDNDTLAYEIIAENASEVLLAVTFEEVVMEGAGCIADRKPCYGRVKLIRRENGDITRFEIA